MNSTAAPVDLPGAARARAHKRRKRFLAAAIAGLAILGASLGVSFLGPSGTTTVGVTAGGSSNMVYPVTSSGLALPSAVTSLEYTNAAGVTAGTGVLPNWSDQIAAGSAGTVDTPGDVALIDATQAPNAVIVNMYVTNLADLQQAYSSFAFNVNVYSSPCTSGTCTWTQASSIVGSTGTYITNTDGFLSFRLPATGKYYDIVINTGGSFYTVSTSAGSLSPSYYLTAQST